MNISREDLSKLVGEKLNITKDDCDAIFLCYLETIREQTLKGNNIKLMNFGIFSKIETKTRKGRNPKTGEEIDIEGKVLPDFKFSKRYKDNFDEDAES